MNFYAVHKGKNIGIFTNWEDCKKSVLGYKNARFKKFDNEEDAKYFSENGTCKKYQENVKVQNDYINVYTDGSLFKANDIVCCGYGIYIPLKNLKIYKSLESDKITNNRAELMAIIESLQILKNEDNIMIHTDSQYCIYIFTGTGNRYKESGYINKSGNFYPNHDLIEIGLNLIKNKNILFNKIESHTQNLDENSKNNDVADELAILGAIECFKKYEKVENFQFSMGQYFLHHKELKNIEKSILYKFLENENVKNNLKLKEKLKINYLFTRIFLHNE